MNQALHGWSGLLSYTHAGHWPPLLQRTDHQIAEVSQTCLHASANVNENKQFKQHLLSSAHGVILHI